MFRNYEERGATFARSRLAAHRLMPAAARVQSLATAHIRERWRMSVEARALVLVTAVLLAFGLAVLYSASAIVAVDDGPRQRLLPRAAARRHRRRESWLFAIAAKIDAERWSQLGVAAHGADAGADADRDPAVHAIDRAAHPWVAAVPVRRVGAAVGAREARGRGVDRDAGRAQRRFAARADQRRAAVRAS